MKLKYLLLIGFLFVLAQCNHDDETIIKTSILYLNVTGEAKEIPVNKTSHSILWDKDYNGNFTIAPYEPEFIEIQ